MNERPTEHDLTFLHSTLFFLPADFSADKLSALHKSQLASCGSCGLVSSCSPTRALHAGLVQTLAGVGLSGVNLRVTHNPPDNVTLSYADIDASIEIADVETCHRDSVMHFVSHMLRPMNMPEQYMDWIDGTGDIWNNTAQSQLQRNSTMLMSILLVLCVVGLLFGVFWGRRKLNLNSERLAEQRARRAIESAHGRMLGFSLKGQDRAPLIAVFEPKVLLFTCALRALHCSPRSSAVLLNRGGGGPLAVVHVAFHPLSAGVAHW